MVVLAHLKALETRRSPDQRHAWKIRLVKGLYGRGMAPEDVRRLFEFIDWVLELPEPLDQLFREDLAALQQEKSMPFISTPERMGLEKGLLQGIEVALRMKFGPEGLALMPELRQIPDHVLLERILNRIETADSPGALRRYWTRKRRPKAAKSE